MPASHSSPGEDAAWVSDAMEGVQPTCILSEPVSISGEKSPWGSRNLLPSRAPEQGNFARGYGLPVSDVSDQHHLIVVVRLGRLLTDVKMMERSLANA